MSEAIKSAERAPNAIEHLIREMLEAKATDNVIGLGELELEGKPLQIQLVVTMNQEDFLDDDSIISDDD